MTVETFVSLVQTASLVAVSLLLAYPVARRSTNVAHARGMVALSAAFFALSVGYAIGTVTDQLLLERVVILVAAVLGLVGTAYFARPFLEFDDSTPFDGSDPFGGSGPFDGSSPFEDPSERNETGGTEGGFDDAVRE